MKIQIEINAEKILGKAKEIDISKLLEFYQKFEAGEEIKLFDGNIVIKKSDEAKKK